MMPDFSRLASHTGRLLAGAAIVLACAGGAYAQGQRPAPKPAPAPAPAQAPGTPKVTSNPNAPIPEWLKVCTKDEKSKTDVCFAHSYMLAEQGNVVGEVRVLELKRGKETRRAFEALVPPGFLIQPGVQLVVDDAQQPIAARYKTCFPNTCLVDLQVTDDILGKIKKGNVLSIFLANQQGQWVPARISLAGFTKVFEGAAIDPKAYEEKRKQFAELQNKFVESSKNLEAELLKQAEEARKKAQGQKP